MTNLATLKKEEVVQVKPKGVPEGFISLGELAEKYPGFKKKYLTAIREKDPMKIWLDEESSIFVKYRDTVIEEDPDGTINKETGQIYTFTTHPEVIIELEPRKIYDTDVVNFVRMFGDPHLRFDLKEKPRSISNQQMKVKRWIGYKMDCLEICRRALARKPAIKHIPDPKNPGRTIPMKMACTYTEKTYQPLNCNKNDSTKDLWGQLPKVWCLPPDMFEMAVKGSTKPMTIEDHAWDAMQLIPDMKLNKNLSSPNNKKTPVEIESVRLYLVDKGEISETSPAPMVRGIMQAAQEKYIKKDEGVEGEVQDE